MNNQWHLSLFQIWELFKTIAQRASPHSKYSTHLGSNMAMEKHLSKFSSKSPTKRCHKNLETWNFRVFFNRTFASSWWHIENGTNLLQGSTGSTKKTSINVCNLNLNCISKLSGEIRQTSPVLGSIPCDF